MHVCYPHAYIKHYNAGGLAKLLPAYGQGRPRLLDWDKGQWLDLLHQPPSSLPKLESGAQNWTQELLQKYFACYQHQALSQGTISKAIKRAGLRWRRAKLTIQSPDPLYLVKRQRVRELSEKALQGTLTSQAAEHPPPEGVTSRTHLVFFDSTDLHWCPDMGTTYNAQGQQVKVGSPGYDNPWYGLLGSLHYPSGEGLYTVHTNKRHQEVQAHLQLLIDQDPQAFWFVVLDNASAHTTPKLDSFCQSHTHRLELVFLPTYSPHLNLIERLWRFMRGQVTRNQFFDSLTTVAETVVNWLENLPLARFCSLMGLDESQLQFV
ncbi:MAG: IS630 family transposase [Chloroflexi bacterium]|nr:IS630 family transposase [Chloroflexota bacterium]